MYDAEMQSRFAKCYGEAMVGYMRASSAATAAVMQQMIDVWAGAARSMSAPAEPKSASTALPTPSSLPAVWPFAMWNPLLAAFDAANPTSASRGKVSAATLPIPAPFNAMFPWLTTQPALSPQQMLHPMDIWLAMTPFGRSPMVLQMAVAMMSIGVPRDVAMPAAEANAAALRAAETATEPLRAVLASHRTDGGHATAQIQRLALLLVAAPIGAAAFAPWINASAPGFWA
jgi:hypothetical protein